MTTSLDGCGQVRLSDGELRNHCDAVAWHQRDLDLEY